jgi:hypothetical protein
MLLHVKVAVTLTVYDESEKHRNGDFLIFQNIVKVIRSKYSSHIYWVDEKHTLQHIRSVIEFLKTEIRHFNFGVLGIQLPLQNKKSVMELENYLITDDNKRALVICSFPCLTQCTKHFNYYRFKNSWN